MSTNTPNTIDLYLMENRSIMAKVNGYPIGNQNGYLIIAGEENATQFKIASIPDIYSGYTLSVEMVNSRGAGIEEKEIEDNTFVLPEGMAVAGYGQIQIYAKKTVSGREIKVPFNLIRVKVSNTISTWEESISPGAVESAKKSAAEAKSYAESAKKDSESAATAASVAESSKEAAESAAQEATQSAQSAAESASTAQNAAEEAVNTLEGKLDKTTGTGAVPRAYTVSETGEQSMTDLNSGIVPRTIVYRNATGYFDVLDPAQYTNPVSLRYYNQNVPTAVQEGFATQTALANTQRQVDGLYTLLEQKNEIYVQTATDTYTTRETAGGENIADGVQTPVKKITGKTVKTTNLFSGENVTTGNCTYENGVAKQIAADNSSTLVWKAQLYKDTTFVSQVEVQFLNTGRTPALTFEKTSDVNRLAFGLNGASVDTLLSIYISEFPNGEYTITWNVLNTTQGSISWNDIMLNEGSTALPYMPYFSGLKNAFFKEIVSTGRNLIPYPYYDTTKTINGVTFTLNDDYSVTVNGTSTSDAAAEFYFVVNSQKCFFSKGTYTINSNFNGENSFVSLFVQRYHEDLSFDKTLTSVKSGSVTFENDTAGLLFVRLYVEARATVNNVTMKPMLNYGSSALPYEPYTKSVLSLPEAVELTEYDTAYPETGEIQRQSNTLTFNGTENWYVAPSSNVDYFFYTTSLPGVGGGVIICDKLKGGDFNTAYTSGVYVSGNDMVVYFLKSAYPNLSTTDEWKAQLAAWNEAGNPLTVTYKTAEITTEQADFSADSYIAWKNGSETIEQGNTDNSIYGAENTVEQDYYLLTAPEEVTKE